jgi:hypothetical protein
VTESRGSGARPIIIGGASTAPGGRQRLEIPIARLPALGQFLSLPVEVVHGVRPGPCLWLSAAIHGDELNGVEIIRQVRSRVQAETLRGTLVAVPIVNAFGFINESRYLPDRRDLNRSFPGAPNGSLAGRLAHTFMEEIVRKCTHGIDLHTGSDHRTNLPQIRGDFRDAETRACGMAFGAPLMLDAKTRDGSLRDAASRLGIPVLLYEAGEQQRFNDDAIDVGVRGVVRVMAVLGMVPNDLPPLEAPTVLANKTTWVRARTSGMLRLGVRPGEWVRKKHRVGVISDSFGEHNVPLVAPRAGLVIGQTNNPLVRRGDACVHLAVEFEGSEWVERCRGASDGGPAQEEL